MNENARYFLIHTRMLFIKFWSTLSAWCYICHTYGFWWPLKALKFQPKHSMTRKFAEKKSNFLSFSIARRRCDDTFEHERASHESNDRETFFEKISKNFWPIEIK